MSAPVYKATDIITVTRLGHTFKASRRSVAWLDMIIAAFARRFPHATLIMRQSCYNTDVRLSAGTHDYDAVFDFWFSGVLKPGLTLEQSGYLFQRFFRVRGAGAEFRHTGSWASPSMWHIHLFILPVGLQRFATVVGYLVDGGLSLYGKIVASSQLADYLAGRDGTASHAFDRTWRPLVIRLSVFRYRLWVARHGVPKGIGEK